MNNYKQTPLDSPPKKNFFLTVVYHICRQVAIATLHKFKIFCAIFHTPVKLLSIVSRVFVLIITIHYYSVLPCIWQISKKNTRPFVVFDFTCNSPAANSPTCILRKGSVLQKVFITLAKKFTRISELTPEVLHTFIDKIVVHECAERYKQKSEQQIDIYFTHIGNLNEF